MKFVKNQGKQTFKSVSGSKKTQVPERSSPEPTSTAKSKRVKRRQSLPIDKNEFEAPLKKFKQQPSHSKRKIKSRSWYSSADDWAETPVEQEEIELVLPTRTTENIEKNKGNDEDPTEVADEGSSSTENSEEDKTFSSEDDDTIEDANDGNSSTEERASDEDDDDTYNTIESGSDDGNNKLEIATASSATEAPEKKSLKRAGISMFSGTSNLSVLDNSVSSKKKGKKRKQSEKSETFSSEDDDTIEDADDGNSSTEERASGEDDGTSNVNVLDNPIPTEKKRKRNRSKLMDRLYLGDTSIFDKLSHFEKKVKNLSAIKNQNQSQRRRLDVYRKCVKAIQKIKDGDLSLCKEKQTNKIESADASDKAENADASDIVESADVSDEIESADVSDEVESADASDEVESANVSNKIESAGPSGENLKWKTGETSKKTRYVLFVGNLPYTVNQDQITEHFMRAGKVVSVRIPRDLKSNVGRGFAFVEFTNKESYEKALCLHHTFIGGRQINVHYTTSKKEENVPAKKSMKAKNMKLAEMRKRGLLAGSLKEGQKRSARRGKKKKATNNNNQAQQ